MIQVKELLPKFKANSKTYYNLSKKDIAMFKSLYNYLKRNKEKYIKSNVFQHSDAIKGQINYWLNNENELDYLKKYKAMEIVSFNLIH